MRIKFAYVVGNRTVEFAAEEIRKYLLEIDSSLNIDVIPFAEYEKDKKGFIFLDFGKRVNKYIPKVKDIDYDDAFSINIVNGTGYIFGTTPVSVLIGVYRLLKSFGVAFIRPGKRGEIIPKKSISKLNFSLTDKASYRVRGINLDDEMSFERCLDMIDFLPKEGYNQFFIEGTVYYHNLFKHFYGDSVISSDNGKIMMDKVFDEARKRGLRRHSCGHGWHFVPMGYTDLENVVVTKDFKPTEQMKKVFAERNGKREIYLGKNLFGTQLCYSNPEVKEKMVSAIVNYIEEHQEIDYVHFWLADGCNNHCECENCQKMRPSDFYVDYLNEIDDRLTRKDIKSKVVCLIYVDLLWAPEKIKLKNPDRFILMFAPITRTYDNSYADFDKPNMKLLPYVRNKLDFPKTAADNCGYLADWQKKQLKGDSFLFDYHLMWNQYKDPGYNNLSRVICEDMKGLSKMGLNGSVSCEITKSTIPHDFPHRIMGRALWNKEVDFEKEQNEFLFENYGKDYKLVKAYLKKLSDAFDVIYKYESENYDEKAEKNLEKITVKAVESIMPVIEKNLKDESLPYAVHYSWELLFAHTGYVKQFAKTYTLKYIGKNKEAERELKVFCKICDRIFRDYSNDFSTIFAKYSVTFYMSQITKDGAKVILQ